MRIFATLILLLLMPLMGVAQMSMPWSHGALRVSDNGAFLCHADGTPFFWLGDTGWLMPEKLNRQEVTLYLDRLALAGYNVVQVQTINGVPAVNAYGQSSHPDGWDFSQIDSHGFDGYWQHLDYIMEQARQRGIYVAMVCIWGGLVKKGLMGVDEAVAYGNFLAGRYSKWPNVIWIIGGDIRGDVNPEVWGALAMSIKEGDKEHLMTFHPFGRTSSAYWWHDATWLDLNMYQSGHRRYDQRRGDGDDAASAAVAEDNWRYVDDGLRRLPRKPIIDGEPSYEGIPQGLHDTSQPRWQAHDARRYAYWSVFAGAAGHTYGNNSIMQMLRPGDVAAYGATKPWYEALDDEGFNQMKHLKDLMLSLPYFERVPDQSLIISANGERYHRAIATRGDDYILVYNYSNDPIGVDLDKVKGNVKDLWWFDPKTGCRQYIGQYSGQVYGLCCPVTDTDPVNDRVLIAIGRD